MRRSLIFFLFSISSVLCYAQEAGKGFRVITLSVGPNFSNLAGSEAPHKINIEGSDQHPAVLPVLDVTQAAGYFDYKTSLTKDLRTGIAIRLGTEFRFNDKWSLYGAPGYEEKGIDLKHFSREALNIDLTDPDVDDARSKTQQQTGIVYHDEYFEVDIINAYLTLPVLLRRYMRGEKFYVQGGIYAGWLLQSKIRTFKRKHDYIADQNISGSDSQFSGNFTDQEKEFTNNFEPGLSLGCGVNIPLSGRLSLNADLLLNAGLRKIDRKYNNEYSEEAIPMAAGIGLLVRSTNYYGLNSNATNVSASLTAGLSYALQ